LLAGNRQQFLAFLVGDCRRAREQPQVLAVGVPDQGHAVVLVVVKHPVLTLGQARSQPAEPVVELHPELVSLARLLGFGDALGLVPLAVLFLAAVVDVDAPVLTQAVTRFGLNAVALKEHWQARQLIPGALVALQVDLLGGRRRAVFIVRTRAADQGKGHAGKHQCRAHRHSEPP